MLMAKIYDSKRIQNKSAKARHKHFMPPAMSYDKPGEVLCTREALQRFSAQGFTGGSSRRHPLTSTYQNSRCSEGKQVLSVNSIIYTNNLGTVHHSHQLGRVGNFLKSKFPEASPGPTLQAGL